MEVSILGQSGRWASFELPITRERLESMRKLWHDVLSADPAISVTSIVTARVICKIDDMPLDDFDKIIVGMAVIAPDIRYE